MPVLSLVKPLSLTSLTPPEVLNQLHQEIQATRNAHPGVQRAVLLGEKLHECKAGLKGKCAVGESEP